MNELEQLNEAEKVLASQDPVLAKLIKLQRPIAFRPRSGYFFSLCRTIIGQQVSVAAAAAIFSRFEAATDLKPEVVVGLSDEKMREIGLSRQKIAYIRDLALHFAENPKIYNHLEKLPDDKVIADLTAIKGIGEWSAQMFLMFTLRRLDVFAPDDIGIKRAIKQLYGLDNVPSRDELIELAEKWRPYRSVACWHLWQSLHSSPA